jgi:hypothetical protein
MATYIIIGGNQKEYGPITGSDVRQWISEGRLNEHTPAKAEGDADWRPLAVFPEFADLFATSESAPAVPVTLSNDELLAQINSRSAELRLGECLAAGWNFLAANYLFLLGAVFLTWFTNLILVFVSIYVPLLGPFIALCFHGVIMGGFYLACLCRMRGQIISPIEVFSGFKSPFVQLVLTGLVTSLLTELSACCLILPAIYLTIAWSFTLLLVADKKMFFWSAMELSRKIVTRVWFEVLLLMIIAFAPIIIFQIINFIKTGQFFLGLYDEANQNWQQLSQLIPTRMSEIHKFTLQVTLIGQAVLLINLFYCAGVMARAYENLFGTRKN